MTENDIVRIKIKIRIDQLRASKFRTVLSPFPNPVYDIIYYAEYEAVKKVLDVYGVTNSQIVAMSYVYGNFGSIRPYQAAALSIYEPHDLGCYELTIIIPKTSKVIKNQINLDNKNQKLEINILFSRCKTIEQKKKLYRLLMLKHHPDKGGSEEISKYINSLKNW